MCKSEVCRVDVDTELCCIAGPVTTTTITTTVTTSTSTTTTVTTTEVAPIVVVLREMGVDEGSVEPGSKLALSAVVAVALFGALAAAAVGVGRCARARRQRASLDSRGLALEMGPRARGEDLEAAAPASAEATEGQGPFWTKVFKVVQPIYYKPIRPLPPLIVSRQMSSPVSRQRSSPVSRQRSLPLVVSETLSPRSPPVFTRAVLEAVTHAEST
jgi:hypothetical protein